MPHKTIIVSAITTTVSKRLDYPPQESGTFQENMNPVALRKEKHDLVKKAQLFLDRIGTRKMTADEDGEYDKMSDAIEEMSKRIQRLEALAAQDDDDAEEKDDAPKDDDDDDDDDKEEKSRSRKGLNYTSQKRSIWAGDEVRTDRQGSKEYTKAFGDYLRTGKVNREFRDFSLTGGDGAGSLVTPTAISKEFVTFLNNYTFIRSLANIQYVNDAQSLGNPRLLTDVADADWTAEVPESDISSDTTGSMDRRDLTPALLTKLELISLRELQLAPQIVSIVMDRLAYKFAVTEEKGFLTGDGTTDGNPLGVFYPSSSGISTGRDITASSTTGFSADDLLAVTENIAQQYTVGDKFCWIMSRAAVLRARKLKDGQGNYLYGVSLAAGRPDLLCGYPLMKSEYAPSTFTTGLYVAILGNFNFYRIALVGTGAPVIQTLVERYAGTNQVGYIGREWVDGGPMREEAFSRLKLA